jgi:hypothetical protein
LIATEARISGIDETRKEYYDYLSSIYGEIASYLKIWDGMVNAQKLELMFEKTASPFVYWNESRSRNDSRQEMSEEKRMSLLKALAAKYKLRASEDKFFTTSRLEREDYERLSENMKLAGYRYDSKDRAFVRDVK